MTNEHQKDDTQADDFQTTDNTSGAFEKFRQTISSSLLTAQDKGKIKARIISNSRIRKCAYQQIVFAYRFSPLSTQ